MAETLFSSSTPSQAQTPDNATAFYTWVAGYPDDEAAAVMLRTLLRELRFEPDTQRAAILDRFRSWLRLTPEQGARVAAAYDRARDQLPPDQQIALDEAERNVVRHGLTYRDFDYLSQFVPWLRAWHVPAAPERPVSGVSFGLALALG
jgi:hypothetical protein